MIVGVNAARVAYRPLQEHLEACGLETSRTSNNLYHIVMHLQEVATGAAQAAVEAGLGGAEDRAQVGMDQGA